MLPVRVGCLGERGLNNYVTFSEADVNRKKLVDYSLLQKCFRI